MAEFLLTFDLVPANYAAARKALEDLGWSVFVSTTSPPGGTESLAQLPNTTFVGTDTAGRSAAVFAAAHQALVSAGVKVTRMVVVEVKPSSLRIADNK
ncbi:MAG: hypothetical protein JJ863_15920 [Deltaproteobacteria bacterium]|nr:hypothetical protein [Deltaproteobacteria bacterium]